MIDQATVERILDAANIYGVVSDFVTLRRRGANYVGLCPFHDEKTPSFSVSPARGICKCFSCGKGGNAVHFIMEHEQISFYEALRYLARKYNIEIKEQELTEEEKQRKTDRESMLIVNDFAQKFFATTLLDHVEGRAIGMGYFRERGFGEDIIRKFGLGFSPEKRDALAQEALRKGYKKEYLLKTGLCLESQQGNLYDRFKGRVIFPVYSLSGKVIAFGGRILKKDEKAAKYVNSPESEVYHKSDVLYGIYHAKQSIVKNDCCYLVEGYTDVLSMHQAGIENVVASSGTSLTPGQIRLIHRFTNNITVLYDGDSAGIKASLRGIDLILQEGMNIKVVLLPDGDDPDSFSKKQSATDFTNYIKSHETDFIRFKTRLLLEGAGNDPIKRAALIGDIVRSIAIIPDNILRSVYVQECSRLLETDEQMLSREVNKIIRNKREQEIGNNKDVSYGSKPKTGAQESAISNELSEVTPAVQTDTLPATEKEISEQTASADDKGATTQTSASPTIELPNRKKQKESLIEGCERLLLQYIMRYGYATIQCYDESTEEFIPLEAIDFIDRELTADNITFTHPLYSRIYADARNLDRKAASAYGEQRLAQQLPTLEAEKQQQLQEAYAAKQPDEKLIKLIEDRFATASETIRHDAEISYIGHYFVNSPDLEISTLAIDLVNDRYQLSKIHTKFQVVTRDADRLNELIPRAIFELKDAILMQRIEALRNALGYLQTAGSTEEARRIMEQIAQYTEVRKNLAIYLGERIIMPGR